MHINWRNIFLLLSYYNVTITAPIGGRLSHSRQEFSITIPGVFPFKSSSRKTHSKHRSFNSCLLLRLPSNWRIFQEDNISSSGSSGEFISCMVWINKYSQINFLAPWLRCIGRNHLLHVTIKTTPIMLLKHWHVRIWICRIENHPGIVMALQISKNSKHRLKVTLPL